MSDAWTHEFILEFEPSRRPTVSWPDRRGDESVPAQRVTWTLEREGEGTRVPLVHPGFGGTVDISDGPFGRSHFMTKMADVARSVDAE